MLKGKRKLIVIPVLLIVLGGAGYSFAQPKPVVKMKIKGTIYAMPKSFLLNLSDGHYVKLDVALLLAPGQSDGVEGEAAPTKSSGEEGEGTLPEEAVIRDIITNIVTGKSSADLVNEHGREAIKHEILTTIAKQTDVKVESILFPDLTVQ